MADYEDQYTKLWFALNVRAKNGRPTLIIGGNPPVVAQDKASG